MRIATAEIAFRRMAGAALGLMALVAVALPGGPSLAVDRLTPEDIFVVTVENASAKVGEKTAIVARVAGRGDFRMSESYRNKVRNFSSLDDAVAFEKKAVRGWAEDGVIVFTIGVTPIKPGVHPVNGVFRVSANNGERLEIMSVRLIATVTGLE
jgi:hypothetical protein